MRRQGSPRADGPAGSGDLAQAVDDLVPVLPDHLAIAEVHLAKVHRAQLVSPLVGFGRDLISDGLTHFVSVVAVLGSAVNRRRTDISLRFTSAPFVISVGHRTGLFEAMRNLRPATSQEIAGAAELNERYVREWLGAMTAAGIVQCDERGERFSLPSAHGALLSHEPGTDNVVRP